MIFVMPPMSDPSEFNPEISRPPDSAIQRPSSLSRPRGLPKPVSEVTVMVQALAAAGQGHSQSAASPDNTVKASRVMSTTQGPYSEYMDISRASSTPWCPQPRLEQQGGAEPDHLQSTKFKFPTRRSPALLSARRCQVCRPLCVIVLGKMGSTSWHDNILQALLIGLVVQIIVSTLCVFCAFLWASWKGRMARHATGESKAESDLEMGTENIHVGEGAITPDNARGLAANSGVGDDGKLEDTEDTADTRASTPEILAVDHPPKADCKTVTEDVK